MASFKTGHFLNFSRCLYVTNRSLETLWLIILVRSWHSHIQGTRRIPNYSIYLPFNLRQQSNWDICQTMKVWKSGIWYSSELGCRRIWNQVMACSIGISYLIACSLVGTQSSVSNNGRRLAFVGQMCKTFGHFSLDFGETIPTKL